MDLKAGYKKTDVGVIPSDWDVFAVRDKGNVLTGKALAANAPGKQRPYLRTKNVFDGRIEVDDVLTMPMTDAQFEQFRVQRGDVLLNEGQSLELVGRCSMYNDEYSEPCAMQNALLRFRAGEGTDATYAAYLFRHCQQTGVFARIALQTTSVAHLGSSRFERLRLPWPTVKREQQAIATALSDVDALLQALERLIAKKRDLKQAAMQQLLTGQTRLPGFTGKWEERSIAAEIDLVTGFPFPSGQYSDSGIRLLRGSNVKRGTTDWSEDLVQYWPRLTPELAKYQLQVGDLVIAMDGSLVGKSYALLSQADLPAVLLQRVARIRSKTIDIGFLSQFIGSEVFISYCDSVKTVTAIPHISSHDIRSLRIPIPPTMAEQTGIASVLSDMDAELSALEQRLAKTRALKQGMMQELLTGRTRLV